MGFVTTQVLHLHPLNALLLFFRMANLRMKLFGQTSPMPKSMRARVNLMGTRQLKSAQNAMLQASAWASRTIPLQAGACLGVLMDVFMPAMTGSALLKTRLQHRVVPIMVDSHTHASASSLKSSMSYA